MAIEINFTHSLSPGSVDPSLTFQRTTAALVATRLLALGGPRWPQGAEQL